MTEGYINYFETEIKDYLPDDLSFKVYDGFNYDNVSDIKFTIVRLAGNIDSGIVRIPYQIICEADSKYIDEIRRGLDNFAIDLNETKITIDNDRVRQLYSTSYQMTNFQQNGLVDRSTIAVNCNLVSFGPVDIDSFVINNDSTIELEDIAISYAATPASAGAKPNDNGKLKRINRDVAISYAIIFVPKNTDVQKNITKQAIFGNGINTNYSIAITTCGVTNTINCVLANATITKNKNGVMAVSATFMAGDFNG